MKSRAVIVSLSSMGAVWVACSASDTKDELGAPAGSAAGAGTEGGSAGARSAEGGALVDALGGAGLGLGGAAAGAGGFATIACADETRAVPYEAGLEVASELGLHVTLVESRPAPRVGNLTWTLQVTDSNAEPVLGANVKLSPFMPDHHHGSPLAPVVTEQGDGVYLANPINLIMPGFWRTTVRVTSDAWTDSVIIPLCIE